MIALHCCIMYVDKAANLLYPEKLNTVRKQENSWSKTILLRLFLKERDLKLLYRDFLLILGVTVDLLKSNWNSHLCSPSVFIFTTVMLITNGEY